MDGFLDIQSMINTMNQGGGKQPGDELYKSYHLGPMIASERMFLRMHYPDITDDQIRAFTIANKVESAIERGDIDSARKMSYHALKLDPECTDALSGLCMVMNQFADGDTVVCAYREILRAVRPFYEDVFEDGQGMFYKISNTRPYMRVLTHLGGTANNSDMLDVATYVYEEMIRLNHSDNTGARSPLACCYMKLIGRRRKHPSVRPIRTAEHLEALLTTKLYDNDVIWSDDEPLKRWATIVLRYHRKQDWKSLVKREYEKNPVMFKVIFSEVGTDELPHDPSIPGFRVGDPTDEAISSGGFIQRALLDWPDLLMEIHSMFRKRSEKFRQFVREHTPQVTSGLASEKGKMNIMYQMLMGQGRDCLTARKFKDAMFAFTMAKRAIVESVLPAHRWYVNAEFAIVSNRATCAAALGMWQLARIDSRYTLLMKPDHVRTYERLPKVAEAFSCSELVDRLNILLTEVKSEPEKKTAEDWRKLAQRGIGLTSLTVIIASRAGRLTEAVIDEAIAVGIEDLYTPVNVSVDVFPTLPWIQEEDMELNV